MDRLKLSVWFLCLNQIIYPQFLGHQGGKSPVNRCIETSQYSRINASKIIDPEIPYTRDPVLFDDPMGNGGINSPGKTLVNYVDLNSSNSLLDYTCGQITYNGHQGTDLEILNFYEMDEGVPILCSAPGVVTYRHDGEFDRQTELINGAASNAVIVSHSDGTETWYWHIRKNSVHVGLGELVVTGDTLGYVGSSGYSTGPHIHFEIHQNGTVDPFSGECQTDTSRWLEQGDYVLEFPFEIMDHGLTTIPLDWAMISERPPTKSHVTAPGTIYSWLRLRNVLVTDELTWEFYANGTFWDSYSFSPYDTFSSSWWYIYWNLPSNSSYFGDWEIKIIRNDSIIGVQEFLYDNLPNQTPTITDTTFTLENDSVLNGEFYANDPDGSIFWYEIVTSPSHGSLEQFGGRKRKFTYTPNDGFSGQDTLIFYAIDDENSAGENGMYILNVLENLAIKNQSQLFTNTFKLTQNYPNPFNPITTIAYQIPEKQAVILSIYNLKGQMVETLVNHEKIPGSYTVSWNASQFSSGLYFYNLTTGKKTVTMKMLLLK